MESEPFITQYLRCIFAFYETLKWITDLIFGNFYDNENIALWGVTQWHLDWDK